LAENVLAESEREDEMSEKHVPRLVKVNGVELLELRGQQVSWQLRTCKHTDDFEHEVQEVTVELVVGAADADDADEIEKAVLLALSPEQAFGLGNLLIAAANRAPFLHLPDEEEEKDS
jgi:hypothetical protein